MLGLLQYSKIELLLIYTEAFRLGLIIKGRNLGQVKNIFYYETKTISTALSGFITAAAASERKFHERFAWICFSGYLHTSSTTDIQILRRNRPTGESQLSVLLSLFFYHMSINIGWNNLSSVGFRYCCSARELITVELSVILSDCSLRQLFNL